MKKKKAGGIAQCRHERRPGTHKLTLGAGRPPHVIIVGAGFAGLNAARILARTRADVTLIDRRNYHLFQPLLYQVATAELSPSDIAVSIRSLFRKYPNVEVLYDEVTGVDRENRFIFTRDNAQQDYDYLIVATGSQYNYFGHGEWSRYAPGLKSIEDAIVLRRDLLAAFEKAETTIDPAQQKEFLTFILIGGGPTGVEMAGSIAELVHEGLGDFRHIDPDLVEIVLIEAGPALLPGYPEKLQRYTMRALTERGVQVYLNNPVESISGNGVYCAGRFIPSSTIIWCAGVKASPAGIWLGAATARNGAVLVKPDLSLPYYPEIFVAGDSAAVDDGRGGYLPGLASVAKQQGEYLGRLLAARMTQAPDPGPFRYTDHGTMATIGRGAAVARLRRAAVTGICGWLLWAVVHIYYLIGFRNRFVVFFNWIWSILTSRRSNWLIIGLSIEEFIRQGDVTAEDSGIERRIPPRDRRRQDTPENRPTDRRFR